MIWERSLISVLLYSSITLLHSSMILLCSISLSRRSFSVWTTYMYILCTKDYTSQWFYTTANMYVVIHKPTVYLCRIPLTNSGPQSNLQHFYKSQDFKHSQILWERNSHLHNSSVMLYQLSYIASPWEQGGGPHNYIHNIQRVGNMGFPTPKLKFPPSRANFADFCYIVFTFPPEGHRVSHLAISKIMILYLTF